MKLGDRRRIILTDKGFYFNALISDCVKELKSKGSCYAFSEEQTLEIKKVFPKAKVREDNGIFNLTV